MTVPAGLDGAVQIMDRLRSPGGCPWDAAQTHASLGRYLIEECYELLDALESQRPEAIREELGDVLLQVLFHARIASEQPDGFDIDAVADTLVDKLVRRHPHVFAAAERVDTAADQQQRWDELKKTEAGRESVLAGVALGQPATALAAKLGARAARAGLSVDLPTGDTPGEQLFRIAFAAGAAGGDPEGELRAVSRQYAAAVEAADSSG